MNAWVFEDDYDSEFRYTGHPLAAMQGLDQNGRVIYAGTFNKVLFPALRLAYTVVPRDLINSFVGARTMFDGYPPSFTQAVLADFIVAGHFTSHIRKMRGLYHERYETLMAAASKYLGDKIRFEPAHTGLHITGWLAKDMDDAEISQRAAQAGLDVPPISRYYLGRPTKAGLILNYATVPPKNIGQGIRTLASVLEQY
jgi:GntR family transcriptional regulator/MocR family aminotransferase